MILLALAAAAAPVPLETNGDWIVGCDNARVCQAVALGQDAAPDKHLALVVRRDPAGDAAAQLAVPLVGIEAATRVALRIDRSTFAMLQAPGNDGGLSLPLTGKLLDRLTKGTRVTIVDTRGKTRAAASLKGLGAALLFIDNAQERGGTVTALRRRGRRAASAVPPPPALPVIAQPVVTGERPRTLSPKKAAKLIGRDVAACPTATGPVSPKAWRLDATHSLVTIQHPCGNGAYNIYTSAFVLDEKGRATPARLDAPSGFGDTPGNQVVNGGWDAQARRLTSLVLGRGIGDCGTRQAFAWDGAMFRLVDQSDMGECRGATDYITTWRAQVVVN